MPDPMPDNPFQFTRPITDPEAAMPQERALDSVLSALRRRECVCVLAPRQTGKTTFLAQLSRQVDSLYVDQEGRHPEDLRGLIQDVLESSGVRLPENSAPVEVLLRKLAEDSQRVVLVDELLGLKSVAVSFLEAVRVHYMTSPAYRRAVLPLVVSGSIDLADLTLGADSVNSPLNFATAVYLDDIPWQDVAAFVRPRAPQFSETAIQKICEYSNGHPFLVQFLCNHLYTLTQQEVEKQIADVASLVDASGVDRSVNVQSMVGGLFNSEKRPRGVIEILKSVLDGERVPFTLSSPLIRQLRLEHGCIRDDGGLCAIRNPIYRLVLERNFEIQRIAAARPRREEIARDSEVVARLKVLERLVAGPVLVNYSGYLCIRVRSASGLVPFEPPGTLVSHPGAELEIELQLSPEADSAEEWTMTHPVRVQDGQDSDAVTFELLPASETLSFEPLRRVITFEPHGQSGPLTFRFAMPSQPEPHLFWIQIFQQNRLALSVRFEVEAMR